MFPLNQSITQQLAQAEIHKFRSVKGLRFIIDFVVSLPSGRYHIGRLSGYKHGLYDVSQTHKNFDCPIDTHRSYHSSGEMHCKVTRGVVSTWPNPQIVGTAKPHTDNKEVVTWRRKGQPWDGLKGVERFGQYSAGIHSLTDIVSVAEGYPIYNSTNADYVFAIEPKLLRSTEVEIDYFIVEPGNIPTLTHAIDEIIDSWQHPSERIILERVELFEGLGPLFAIALLARNSRDQ